MSASAVALPAPEPVFLAAATPARRNFSELLEALPCMAFLEDRGLIVAANEHATALTGINFASPAPAETVFLGTHPFAVAVAPRTGTSSGSGLHLAEPVAFAEPSSPIAFECMLKRGQRRSIAIHGAAGWIAPDGHSGPPLRLIVALEGRRAAAVREDSFFGELLDAAPEAMAVTSDGRLLHVNREFTRLFDYPPESCLGQEIDALLLPTGANRDMETIFHLIAANGTASLETVRRTHSGADLDLSIRVGRVPVGSGHGLFYTFRDISPQKEAEARLRHTAMHDALTGLPNRASFLECLRAALDRLRRLPEGGFAVMFLDLDGFKAANDALGHRAGDALLCEIADRLRECVRPQDLVSRLGGDEFALLFDEPISSADVARVALRLQTSIGRIIELEAGNASVTASIGIKLVADTSILPEEVLHHADVAMYHAKANGKARHEIFHGEMSLQRLRKVS